MAGMRRVLCVLGAVLVGGCGGSEACADLGVAAGDRHRVLVMPECTDPTALHAAYRTLVTACIERGFRLGERLHIALFGHTPGT